MSPLSTTSDTFTQPLSCFLFSSRSGSTVAEIFTLGMMLSYPRMECYPTNVPECLHDQCACQFQALTDAEESADQSAERNEPETGFASDYSVTNPARRRPRRVIARQLARSQRGRPPLAGFSQVIVP